MHWYTGSDASARVGATLRLTTRPAARAAARDRTARLRGLLRGGLSGATRSPVRATVLRSGSRLNHLRGCMTQTPLPSSCGWLGAMNLWRSRHAHQATTPASTPAEEGSCTSAERLEARATVDLPHPSTGSCFPDVRLSACGMSRYTWCSPRAR